MLWSCIEQREGGLSKHQGSLTLWGGDGKMGKETSSGHAGHDKSAPKSGQVSCVQVIWRMSIDSP